MLGGRDGTNVLTLRALSVVESGIDAIRVGQSFTNSRTDDVVRDDGGAMRAVVGRVLSENHLAGRDGSWRGADSHGEEAGKRGVGWVMHCCW